MSQKKARARRKKSVIAEAVTGQRDKLERLYDWHTPDLEDADVSALYELISHMGRLISRFKQ